MNTEAGGSPGRKRDRPVGGNNASTTDTERQPGISSPKNRQSQTSASASASASVQTPASVAQQTMDDPGTLSVDTATHSVAAACAGTSSTSASISPLPPAPTLEQALAGAASEQKEQAQQQQQQEKLPSAQIPERQQQQKQHRHGRSRSEPPTWADVAELVGLKRSISLVAGPKASEVSKGSSVAIAMGSASNTIPLAPSAPLVTLKPPPPILRQKQHQQTQPDRISQSSQSASAAAASSSQPTVTATRRIGRPPDMRSSKPQSASKAAAIGATPAEKRSQQMLATRKRKRADTPLNVFVNVRILLQILDREDRKLKLQAVHAVQYCSERHKAGDPDFGVLSTSIDRMLRVIVGERRWKLAEDCQRKLVAKKVVAKASDGPDIKRSASTAARGGSGIGGKGAGKAEPPMILGRGHGQGNKPPSPSSNVGGGTSAAV
mmetsp:Transcript_941/g.2180  ORF Transcript_941/g.2180 Transcript_941/m.2180 type:complete len:436 (-) Transcript_941:51-1358(-)|eukprot:CAMPEP_0178517982 /NCGR_PEP_ID=MMETSP0696-20121128/25996_1 /TAXON_ID=265572 /ORGANISM="Extubocellulus spinifer, Strain CCMP396" /LENGTH=435 /DNA_ID=CAMNT_0020148479 /DNA_START=458 /DNA_END=1765 /DNA_ORIENTATION=+